MLLLYFFFFFFNDTATTEIYTLSLHDALPIYPNRTPGRVNEDEAVTGSGAGSSPSSPTTSGSPRARSEEHTSELQSRQYLVCRLLLEKKKNQINQSSSFRLTGQLEDELHVRPY